MLRSIHQLLQLPWEVSIEVREVNESADLLAKKGSQLEKGEVVILNCSSLSSMQMPQGLHVLVTLNTKETMFVVGNAKAFSVLQML